MFFNIYEATDTLDWTKLFQVSHLRDESWDHVLAKSPPPTLHPLQWLLMAEGPTRSLTICTVCIDEYTVCEPWTVPTVKGCKLLSSHLPF